MKATFKNLKTGIATSSISLDHEKSDPNMEVKALCVLLGGYNKYGRVISVEKYHELKERFDSIIDDVADALKQ